jgi:hypothetical protein
LLVGIFVGLIAAYLNTVFELSGDVFALIIGLPLPIPELCIEMIVIPNPANRFVRCQAIRPPEWSIALHSPRLW